MVSSIALNGRVRVQFNKISGLIDPCRSRFVSRVLSLWLNKQGHQTASFGTHLFGGG